MSGVLEQKKNIFQIHSFPTKVKKGTLRFDFVTLGAIFTMLDGVVNVNVYVL